MSRDRDRILEQALKHELRAAGTPPAGAPALGSFSEGGCLDAETLGAWSDGGLDAASAANAEAHISSCPRCLSLVGTMARGTLSTSGTAGTLGTSGTLGTLPSGAFPWWRWGLAPLAAGLTAVTLWMVIPEQQQRAVAPPVAMNDQTAAPAASSMPQSSAEAVLPSPAAAAPAEQSSARDNFAAAARDDRQQNKLEERKEQAPQRQLQERAALADAAVPPPPAAPAAPPPPPAMVALEGGSVAGLAKARAATDEIDIATVQRNVRWRISGKRILRTDDGGSYWRPMYVSQLAVISAGSAPSPATGWFVGGAGLVLITTDSGLTFTDVSLAEPLDLASVSATDARSASIYAVNGRRFRTADGGRTWQPF